jgi:hypothetical protein
MGTTTSHPIALAPPLDYTPPPFPSLYWPIYVDPGAANHLYYPRDVWRFTLLWTLIVYGAFHLAAGLYAVAMQARGGKWRMLWMVPVVYVVVAGVEAAMAGSVVGLM